MVIAVRDRRSQQYLLHFVSDVVVEVVLSIWPSSCTLDGQTLKSAHGSGWNFLLP
jgi:hypothetical protein